MAECYNFSKKISQYLDNELSKAEKIQFERHREECLSCRKKFSEIQTLVNYMHKMPAKKTSESFNVVLRSRLRKELKTPHKLSIPVIRPVWQLATLCLIACISVYTGMFIDRKFIRTFNLKPDRTSVYLRPIRQASLDIPKSDSKHFKMKNYVMDELKLSDIANMGRLSNYNTLQTTDSLTSNPPNTATFQTANAIVRF